MMKLENKRKIVITRKRMFILVITLLVILSSLIFYIVINKFSTTTITITTTKINSRENIVNYNPNEIEKCESIISENQSVGQYTPWTVNRAPDTKIAYLTFDDGPSVNTYKILNILNQNNIKATFFIIGKNAQQHKNLVRKEFADGEMIGNHTYSHQLSYKEEPETFVNDIKKCEEVLKSILGPSYNLKLVRFPGGSFGDKLVPFKYAVTKAGYRFVDWNDAIGDADGYNLPVPTLLNNLKKYTLQKTVVILMHDAGAKTTTVKALPQIIQYLKSKGYTFDTLHE